METARLGPLHFGARARRLHEMRHATRRELTLLAGLVTSPIGLPIPSAQSPTTIMKAVVIHEYE